eukprot:Gregarina_sp_Poly_1__3955@NODE_218_length_11257_cov_139_614120_g192_i0_p2_GENE_NODE_218_length_11257_cov_139_614120_g192_i0NODE_218_length_11257_cov_139_614120_g192_i0_p2_ORF_typecomplete_len873_score104_33zfMIZ/PF02891_20/3_7e03zfMIZ/PF02891_20/1_6e03zfMIZ/PF02891_20/4_3e16SAP/PF02037_27/9_4e07PINIT/PF14324_6/0_00017PHD/PF00628_29/0_00053PHD/PF00628_29/16zfNse/PF11789_8/0_00053Rubredoxin/PF00301_20/0_0063Rubredoxin/PF00301_20/5e02Rho_N/PF07498_12/0_36PHD_2/PF13831_6/0_026PHD_2/PF13831_6/2_3e02T
MNPDAQQADMRKRLSSYKVSELRGVAQQCGVRISGKKAELIERLSAGADAKLLTKILQSAQQVPQSADHEQLSYSLSADGGGQRLFSVNIDRPNRKAERRSWYDNTQDSYVNNVQSRSTKKRRVDSLPQIKMGMCLCKGHVARIGHFVCPQCQVRYHERCLGVDISQLPEDFQCPRCRVKDIDPFYPTMAVLHLHQLWDDPTSSATSWSHRSLPLSSPNLHDLRRKGFEVFIFCLRLVPEKNWKLHEWPMQVKVTVNEQEELIKEPEYEHKRRDVPMKVTPYLSAELQSNDIRISALNFKSPSPSQYFAAVCLCAKMVTIDLAKTVVENQALSYEEAEAQAHEKIKNFFGVRNSMAPQNQSQNEEDDDEIGLIGSTLRVKLICPITLTKIITPVRGIKCQHLQCYDLTSYLQVTKATRAFGNRWKCVECNTITRPTDLVIDAFFEQILKATDENAEAVEFKSDGSWEQILSTNTNLNGQLDEDERHAVIQMKEEQALGISGLEAEEQIELVDLESSDEDDRASGTVSSSAVVSEFPPHRTEKLIESPITKSQNQVGEPSSSLGGGVLSPSFEPPGTSVVTTSPVAGGGDIGIQQQFVQQQWTGGLPIGESHIRSRGETIPDESSGIHGAAKFINVGPPNGIETNGRKKSLSVSRPPPMAPPPPVTEQLRTAVRASLPVTADRQSVPSHHQRYTSPPHDKLPPYYSPTTHQRVPLNASWNDAQSVMQPQPQTTRTASLPAQQQQEIISLDFNKQQPVHMAASPAVSFPQQPSPTTPQIAYLDHSPYQTMSAAPVVAPPIPAQIHMFQPLLLQNYGSRTQTQIQDYHHFSSGSAQRPVYHATVVLPHQQSQHQAWFTNTNSGHSTWQAWNQQHR